MGYLAPSTALDRTPPRYARQIFHSVKAPHRMTSVQAGEVEAVHKLTTDNVWAQQGVVVEGQTDILTMGLPYISPYNVNSILNPILVACLGLGYLFNMYRGRPLVREGGVLIMTHPTPWEFNPVHHPSYIDFFEQVLSETTDPIEVADRFEESFATDPWYIHLYRTGHAYHGVHPFYMWYWCAHALQHLGGVIIVGGDAAAVHRLGFRAASTLADALEMAQDVVGPSPTLTHLHAPPDPDGRRPVTSTPPMGSSNSLRPARAVRTDAALGGRAGPAAGGGVRRGSGGLTPSALLARAGRARFPLAAPSWPESVPRPAPTPELGVHYDTAWSRRYPVRLARAMVLDNVARPLARVVASPLHPGRRGPRRAGGAGDLRRQPRQPRRHPPAVELPPPPVPPPHRGGGGGRLLLRPAVEGRRLVVPAGRHPHRADQGQPAVGRPGRRTARRRLEPGHLPRGRPLARRLGPDVPRRRRLPGRPHRTAGGAGPPRRHPAHPAQGAAGVHRTRPRR